MRSKRPWHGKPTILPYRSGNYASLYCLLSYSLIFLSASSTITSGNSYCIQCEAFETTIVLMSLNFATHSSFAGSATRIVNAAAAGLSAIRCENDHGTLPCNNSNHQHRWSWNATRKHWHRCDHRSLLIVQYGSPVLSKWHLLLSIKDAISNNLLQWGWFCHRWKT